MKDEISITRLKLLHPKIQGDVISFIDAAETQLGITLRIVQGLRTFQQQQDIYDQGRTKPGKIVSNAKPGSSYHNYGLAIDIAPLENGKINWEYDYPKLYPIAENYGFTCGGKFKSIVDKPHFEKNYGYNWKELLKKHDQKRFIAGTEYVEI